MSQDRDYNYHSEEAQEILGRIPPWIIRWGITIVFLLFAVIILGCCFIRYPERVIGTVTITTINGPVEIVAKLSGNFDMISVSNGDVVTEGDILGIMRTGADYRDVLSADSCLLILATHSPKEAVFNEFLYCPLLMGELQNEWTSFISSCKRYKDYISRSVISKKRILIKEQISKQQEQYYQMQRQFTTMIEDLSYEEKSFVRDSLLFSLNMVSEQEYENAARRVLQNRNLVAAMKSQIITAELAIIQLEQQIVELSIREEDEIYEFEENIRICLERVRSCICEWKLSYLLTSPINGKVSFVRKWDRGQFIKEREHYLTVVPNNPSSTIGIVRIPQAGFGKVNVGQKVNVKLDGYPYAEYGILIGIVRNISLVPEESANNQTTPQYTAEIMFPSRLKTTYGKELRLIQKSNGIAEIITGEKTLIMRFLNPIVALFKNGI